MFPLRAFGPPRTNRSRCIRNEGLFTRGGSKTNYVLSQARLRRTCVYDITQTNTHTFERFNIIVDRRSASGERIRRGRYGGIDNGGICGWVIIYDYCARTRSEKELKTKQKKTIIENKIIKRFA